MLMINFVKAWKTAALFVFFHEQVAKTFQGSSWNVYKNDSIRIMMNDVEDSKNCSLFSFTNSWLKRNGYKNDSFRMMMINFVETILIKTVAIFFCFHE